MRLQFAEYCFDSERREVSRNGAPIHLTAKAMQLLMLLLENRSKVLKKEDIYHQLWPDTFVEEANLSVLVSEIRGALEDDARKPRFVKTAHGYGYGFVGDARPQGGYSNIRLRSGMREFDLVDGENIVGRDDTAQVHLRADGISRRHARITISNGRAIIEDLGSKNGTFVGGQRVDGARELHDGDEIRLSRELLVVFNATAARSFTRRRRANRRSRDRKSVV